MCYISYVLYNSLRFIRGHALVYFLSLVDVLLRRYASFDLVIVSMNLLGIDRKGGFCYNSFLMCPALLESAHYWGCLVWQGEFSKTLDFRGNIEVTAPFLIAPHWKPMFNGFGGGSKVVSEFGINYRVRWLVQYSCCYILLSMGCCPSYLSSLTLLLQDLFHWYPCLAGDSKFSYWLLC